MPGDMERPGENGSDVPGARANSQPGAPAFSSRLAQRKSFHPRRESKDGTADAVANGRPASSGSSSDSRLGPAPSTRIPRPNSAQKTLSKPRAGLSLSEAYRMAGEEGSPSPAPRYRRKGRDSDERRMDKIMGRGPLSFGTKHSPAHASDAGNDDTRSSAGGDSILSHGDHESESDIDKKLMQFEEDQKRIEGVMRGKNGIFSKAKVGPKVAERGQELHRKSSNNSLDSGSPSRGLRPWGVRGNPKQNWLTRIISSPGKVETEDWGDAERDPPVPSIERDPSPAGANAFESGRGSVPFAARSPNKSFAWQADADFTAGDLQVSTSPRVRSKTSQETLGSKPRHNNKIDEIRQLEVEAALRFPDESEAPPSLGPNERGLGGRTNTKIDEIRAREIESLSRKALATARLDEIRERNADYRSSSPEMERKPSRELLGQPALTRDEEGQGRDEKTILEEEGERIPDTPITIFRKSPNDNARHTGGSPEIDRRAKDRSPLSVDESTPHKREDSRDVLRRLARVTSASPTPEDPAENGPRGAGVGDSNLADGSGKSSSRGSKDKGTDKPVGAPEVRVSEENRPSVIVPAPRRVSSTDSASTKRSSIAQSDGDPTDRIEGEMKLFAPLEAQSERGSIRAPSPEPDSDEEREDGVDDTPRAHKPDPLTQPTPRVTGAYVETPLPVKVEPAQDDDGFVKVESQKPLSSVAVASFLRAGASRGGRSDDTKSDSGRKEVGRLAPTASLRRSRSVPRNRSPLFNSAKPPSVREDLLEIQRQHQVDDSTLEDFGELLVAQGLGSTEVDKIVKLENTPEGDEDAKLLSERERELATLDRMSGYLKTGLLGIQTAKKGIERLEDKVAKTETSHHPPTDSHSWSPRAVWARQPPSSVVAYLPVPVPRLFYRRPSFRLSALGAVLVLLAAWLAAETAMCSNYCKPLYCRPGQDCRWSPNDPFFGYAIPVKLDQWATGGQGRALAHRLDEEAGDLLADAWDFVTGADIAAADTRRMTFEERRRWRRRMWKKGLSKPRTISKEQQSKVDAWREVRVARERARDAREMGYGIDELGDESMAADEKVSSRRWL